MFAIAGSSALAVRPLTWNLLFARQPEPDLEFTELWLDEATLGSPSPVKPPKQSDGRRLLWILFFVLISGGAYVAMEDEMVTEYLGSLLDETPAPQPPVARKSAPPHPAPIPSSTSPIPTTAAPSPQHEQDWAFLAPDQPTTPSSPATAPIPTASAPAKALPTATQAQQPELDWSFLAPDQPTTPSSPASSPTATASASAKTSSAATPVQQPELDWSFLAPDQPTTPSSPASSPTATASASAKTSSAATPAKQVEQDGSFLARTQSSMRERVSVSGRRGVPAPLFSEGQEVSVRADLNAPGWTVLLRQDAEGTKPGPTIAPGTALTILDGNLQGRSWVYLVRSDIGSEGWLAEGQLRLKR